MAVSEDIFAFYNWGDDATASQYPTMHGIAHKQRIIYPQVSMSRLKNPILGGARLSWPQQGTLMYLWSAGGLATGVGEAGWFWMGFSSHLWWSLCRLGYR